MGLFKTPTLQSIITMFQSVYDFLDFVFFELYNGMMRIGVTAIKMCLI